MGRKKAAVNSKRKKVISLRMDATFFFEKAVKSLDQFHYEKALKYFRRAVELEPDNPVNHCNLAGVLSELGDYEQSNHILREVINHIDPTMTECYFYMANNYANLEQYELAEEALILYLELDEEGHYVEDCEEMLEWLSYELNRPISYERIKSREEFSDHDKAREMLENGYFLEAVQLLENFIEKNPDFLAAYNNLALAYYYIGDLSACYQAIQKVLQKDSGNIHALCNLAIYYLHVEDEYNLDVLRNMLVRIHPFQHEQVYKLAMTLAILGEHEAAYRHFKRLLKLDDFVVYDPGLFHYAAVAAYNTKRWNEARRLWKQAVQMDPDSKTARFYLKEIEHLDAAVRLPSVLSYHYHLPFEDHFRQPGDGEQAELTNGVKKDPLIRASFFWALQHGDEETKQQVIQAMSFMHDEEVEKALRDFLTKSDESDYLKNLAKFALRAMGSMGSDEPRESLRSHPVGLFEWDERWKRVLEIASFKMKHRYGIVEQNDLETLWTEFLSRAYPNVPLIKKEQGWAAALEYLTAKMHRKHVSYRKLAELYDISESTIRNHVKKLDETINITEQR